jgi:hypothetical protein
MIKVKVYKIGYFLFENISNETKFYNVSRKFSSVAELWKVKGDGFMRLEVRFRLFKNVGDNLIAEDYDRYEIINIETSYGSGIDHLVKVELSEVLGVPMNHFKVLDYKEL